MKLGQILLFGFAILYSNSLFCKADVRKFKEKLLKKQTHTQLLNYIMKSNNYQSYLEIGLGVAAQNFNYIIAPYKKSVDVDPVLKADYTMTSDAFFAQNNVTFDCIFIDGLHQSDQVFKDIQNALIALKPGGTYTIACQ